MIQTDQDKWFSHFCEEYNKESDRASVILAATILDEALHVLLKTYLVPIPSDTDNLFYGPVAPLSAFSSRIDFAYRVGLISRRLCRDLHIIRKIRNDFAHNITGCNFENSTVRNRISELRKSFHKYMKYQKEKKIFAETPRGDFQSCVAWIIFYIWGKVDITNPINEQTEEWGYKIDDFIKNKDNS